MVFCPDSYLSCNEGWLKGFTNKFYNSPAQLQITQTVQFFTWKVCQGFTEVLLSPLSLNLTVFPFLENIFNCSQWNAADERPEVKKTWFQSWWDYIVIFLKLDFIKTSFKELQTLILQYEPLNAILINNVESVHCKLWQITPARAALHLHVCHVENTAIVNRCLDQLSAIFLKLFFAT